MGVEGPEEAGVPDFTVMWYPKRKATSHLLLFLWVKPKNIALKQGEGGGDVEGEVFNCEIESNGTPIKSQHWHEVVEGSHSLLLSHRMAHLPLVWFLLLQRKLSSIGRVSHLVMQVSHPSLHLVPVKQALPFP